VLLTPWWHCYNYYLVHGEGQEVMRITVVTSALGIAVWIALMWVFGPIGIYVGFMTQMLLRVILIVVLARRKWPITVAWEGVAAGVLLTLVGFLVSRP
jgi:peptidoglycan biosynthesis protein MviN/MurJ (putative lipid II flippase)